MPEMMSDHEAFGASMRLEELHKCRKWNSTFAWKPVSREQFEESCKSNNTSTQPNLHLMMDKLNCAAVETRAFKAQGDNRSAKEEDRKLRDDIAKAAHSGNGELVATRKLSFVRKASADDRVVIRCPRMETCT